MASFKPAEKLSSLAVKPLAESHVHSCIRCNGMLIPESLFDLLDNSGEMRRWAYRCIQCGDVVDPLIIQHRTCEELPSPQNVHRRRWTKMQAVSS